jgi:hypothetical protein
VQLIGAGSGGIYGTRGSYFKWCGSAGGTVLAVEGPIENVEISGINVNGNNSAATILSLGAVRFSKISNFYGQAFNGAGLLIRGMAATANNNLMLDFSYLYITTSQPGAIAVDLDGVLTNSTDTWLTTVRNSRFESLGANGVGLRLGFSDNILFDQVHVIASGTGGCGVKFDASTGGTGQNSYPTGNHFNKSAITNTCVVEDGSHTIGVNTFVNFGTTDLEIIPTHSNLRGTTDQGYSFNGYGGPPVVTYSPAMSFNGGAIGTGNTVTGRYTVSGKSVSAQIAVTMGASGVTTPGNSLALTLPFLPAFNGSCHGTNSSTGTALNVLVTNNTTTLTVWTYNAGFPVANGNSIAITCPYVTQ